MIIALGTVGLTTGELLIPGKRSSGPNGVALQGVPAWLMYAAIVCACADLLSVGWRRVTHLGIVALALALLTAPLAAQAQQAAKVHSIGYLGLGSSFEEPKRTAFYRGLQEHGWIEGQNFVLTARFAQLKPERLREMVAELVQRRVDVIVVQSAEGALAAKHGTSTIPIVAVSPADAVAIGLVASLARPGANVAGLSYLGTELIAKQVELLKEAVPNLSRVAALSNPANPTHAPRLRAAAIAAQGLRVHLEPFEARTPSELDKAFATIMRARVGGVLVLSDPMFAAEARRLAQFASASGLPAIYGFRNHVDAGGLISYGPDFPSLSTVPPLTSTRS